MIFKDKFDKWKSESGVTLVEILVAVFIITIFTIIVVVDFPKMKRQFALSRATYKLAQDIRRVEDLGLSGVQVYDEVGALIDSKGYGFYINLTNDNQKYFVYADVSDSGGESGANHKYDNDGAYEECSSTSTGDCIIEQIDLSDEPSQVFIKEIITNGFDDWTDISINFTPPNPTVIITVNNSNTASVVIPANVSIVLSLKIDESITRTININSTGLIEVE